MSKLLNKLVRMPEGALVRRMQMFLFEEEQRVLSGTLDSHAVERDFCAFCVRYYTNRAKQHVSGGKRDRSSGKFHPSSLSGCPRAIWYKMHSATPNRVYDAEDVARGQSIFRNGDLVHLRIQWLLTRMGVLKRMEVPVESVKDDVEGHADGVLNLGGPGDRDTVLEIKSINARGFGIVCRENKPMEAHAEQANRYAHYLKLSGSVILYEEKDTQRWREFWVPYSYDLFRPSLDVIAAVRKAKSSPPPRIGKSPMDQACRWCGFTETCYSSASASPKGRFKLKLNIRRKQ